MPNASAFLLACAVTAMAQDKPINVQGVVTNSLTGEPLLRAHVVLRGASNRPQSSEKRYGALTTVDGKFSITGLDPGSYSVAVDKTGFISNTSFQPLNLQAGDSKDDVKLKLLPAGTITGRVLTADGDPMDNTTVMIDNSPNNTMTDERGVFRIGGLPPGKYRLRATPQNMGLPPEIRTDGTKESHFASTYYPSALLPASATRVEVRAGGESSGIDIRLVRTSIVRISGTVQGLPQGSQFARVELRKGRSGGNGATVKPNGSFEIWKVEPGKYTVFASSTNPANGSRIQSTPVEIEVTDRDIDRIALNILPPIDLAGHVQFEDEKARPQQPGQQGPQRAAQNAQARPATQRLMFNSLEGYSSQNPEVTADESFHVSGLSPNRYRVMISWGQAYVKSIRIGSVVVDGNILDLRQGAAGDSVTVLVSAATGVITGTVNNDQGPAPAAIVALLPEDPDAGLSLRFVNAKADGTYNFAGIPPGKYRIGAVDEADRSLLMRGASAEDYAETTEAIEVSGSDPIKKDLKQRK